ncbi:hypothetical protein NM688_g4215 [Phlebia brevispora]|uniref:Uncharacterized protein n=1 Tax=Phlebia brevispora TaxID=194682 RepID=A0ACC1T3Y8_9APHY|nr:hypothetical protein NM688_g4215 [Phlebia brevispora]
MHQRVKGKLADFTHGPFCDAGVQVDAAAGYPDDDLSMILAVTPWTAALENTTDAAVDNPSPSPDPLSGNACAATPPRARGV